MKPIYVGVDNAAESNRQAYIGVDNIARKVSRMYIGDEYGVARLCYDSTKLVSTAEGTYTYDFSETLSDINHRTYTAFADRFILSGGKISSEEYSDQIDIIDNSLTVSSLELIMDVPKVNHRACVIDGKYLAFIGGTKLNDLGNVENHLGLEIYDKSFTKVLQSTMSYHVSGCTGGSLGKYGVFYGGVKTTSYSDLYDKMICIDPDLTMTYHDINSKRTDAGVAYTDDHIIFAGGNNDYINTDPCNYVEAFDTSLTRSDLSNLSSKCNTIYGATVGEYCLFGSPEIDDVYSEIVDVFDASLTKRSNLSLHTKKYECAVIGTGDEAIFAGGKIADSNGYLTLYKDVEIFDTSLTKSTMELQDSHSYKSYCAKLKDKIIIFYEQEKAAEIVKLN